MGGALHRTNRGKRLKKSETCQAVQRAIRGPPKVSENAEHLHERDLGSLKRLRRPRERLEGNPDLIQTASVPTDPLQQYQSPMRQKQYHLQCRPEKESERRGEKKANRRRGDDQEEKEDQEDANENGTEEDKKENDGTSQCCLWPVPVVSSPFPPAPPHHPQSSPPLVSA